MQPPRPGQKLRLQALFAACFLMLIIFIIILCRSDSNINKANIEFINSYGWEVEEKPTDIAHMTFPEEFDAVFSAYKSIVSGDGFDISLYRGMNVTRYSYKVLNHKESDSGLIRINVFVSDKNIVAADISSLEPNGFILPISDTSDIVQ